MFPHIKRTCLPLILRISDLFGVLDLQLEIFLCVEALLEVFSRIEGPAEFKIRVKGSSRVFCSNGWSSRSHGRTFTSCGGLVELKIRV